MNGDGWLLAALAFFVTSVAFAAAAMLAGWPFAAPYSVAWASLFGAGFVSLLVAMYRIVSS